MEEKSKFSKFHADINEDSHSLIQTQQLMQSSQLSQNKDATHFLETVKREAELKKSEETT